MRTGRDIAPNQRKRVERKNGRIERHVGIHLWKEKWVEFIGQFDNGVANDRVVGADDNRTVENNAEAVGSVEKLNRTDTSIGIGRPRNQPEIDFSDKDRAVRRIDETDQWWAIGRAEIVILDMSEGEAWPAHQVRRRPDSWLIEECHDGFAAFHEVVIDRRYRDGRGRGADRNRDLAGQRGIIDAIAGGPGQRIANREGDAGWAVSKNGESSGFLAKFRRARVGGENVNHWHNGRIRRDDNSCLDRERDKNEDPETRPTEDSCSHKLWLQ